MAAPKRSDPQSRRSKRRQTRNFTSLERDSRKHRRAARRLAESCQFSGGKVLKSGDKTEHPESGHSLMAGGKQNYH